MDCKELNLNEDCGACGSGVKNGGDAFIDRSKVRILLCDNDSKSSEEVFKLLLKCSYQVISVSSARQVIDALNAEGPEIDIILSEVDLPMAKGMKMLKYITRDKELRRIPVIMMSTQDEVPIVVKCLRLGAADYLVKPLRTNELLNLWTHMWRRRRMLGLAEKNILNYEFDLVASDPSDANTNSTTLFSDDTDDKSRRSTNPEMGVATLQEDESGIAAALVEPPAVHTVEHQPDVPGISERRIGQTSSCPRKSELKIGESSAFFTYVKSRSVKTKAVDVEDNGKRLWLDENHQEKTGQPVVRLPPIPESVEALESHSQGDEIPSSTSFPDSFSVERSCTPPAGSGVHKERSFNEENCSQVHVQPPNGSQLDISGLPVQTQTAYPFYTPEGMMSAQLYHKNLHDMHNHAAMMSQYGHFHHCPPNVSGVASYPYYPMNICLQPGQMPAANNTHSWPSFGNALSNEAKSNKFDRREAALIKFRQKRKERCFDKKIRYVNRKRLAERRPRVRGQFVRKVNGVNVDLNGQPASADDVEDEDEEEQLSRDFSHEDDGLGY
ncbi:two-component response regulator-like APRR1 [Cucurbita maxima]|uniref:Two-component response regulator-like APRR1 n=1 Tax=Cucurbita maxima TaxID=3661 RepID=A0A6J1KF10_CUCMA|nr:two-component response regulator-like APRR1 [Cucurbita maxima]XP_023000923.1 two-component response regulator-like APRR1 [Cucurbita maxima]XP_023000924.1 two-component response regulator-like APRR1 [Cucurbita maxima]